MNEKQEKYQPTDIEVFEARAPGVPAVVQDESQGFMGMVERLSANPNVDIDKLKGILDAQERVLDRNEKQAFNASMTNAQNRIELVVAESENKQTQSNYAKLKDILIKAKPVYTKEGFALMFYEGETPKEKHKRTCVDIIHNQGHTKQRYIDLAIQTTGIAGKAMMTEIHGEGSSFSYGRRYLTCMIFNIPTGDDDDGQAVGGKVEEFITEDQAIVIDDLMKETAANEKLFLKWAKAESVREIPVKSYKACIGELERKKAKLREPGDE